jgi:fucose 4-O-acetylase-like acetyltransferase
VVEVASTSRRSLYFDNAKFMLIFLVVFGHVISPLKEQDNLLNTLYTFIFLFHMPAFIMISGFFAKGYQKKGYFKKAIKKILIPYVIFQFIYSLFYFFSGESTAFHINFFQPHWTLWFLMSLFCWNVFLYFFARLGWYGFFLAVALGIGIGYIDNIGSFLSLSRTFVFFPYFLFGFLLQTEQFKKIIRNKFSLPAGIIILIVTILIFTLGLPNDPTEWLMGDTSYEGMGGKQITDGLIRAFQYGATFIVVFGFLSLIPKNEYKVTKIGERTLYVYLFHGFIIKTMETIVPNKMLGYFSSHYLLLICFSLFICFFLGSYLIKKYTRPLVELRL